MKPVTYMKSWMKDIAVVSNKQQAKKQRKLKFKPIISLFMIGVYGVSLYLIVTSVNIIYQSVSLKSNIASTQDRLTSIQGENDYLTAQRDKLKDPNYVQDYARGNYLLSKEGETIFYLPSDENKPSE